MHSPIKKLQKRVGSTCAVESGCEIVSTCGREAVDNHFGRSVRSVIFAADSIGVIVPDAASALLAFCCSHASPLSTTEMGGSKPSAVLRVIRERPIEPVYPHFSGPSWRSARVLWRSNERIPRSAREEENQSLARNPPARPEAEGKMFGEDSRM